MDVGLRENEQDVEASREREQRASFNQRRSVLGYAVSENVSFAVDDDTGNDAMDNSYHSQDDLGEARRSILEVAGDLKRSTLLAPQELEIIQQQNPGLAAWLQSSAGFILQLLLFSVFVGMDAGKAIFASKALKGSSVISTSVVIASSALSILIGLGVAVGADGAQGFRMATNRKAVMKFSAIAVMFAVGQCFQTLSYTVLSPGMIKIFGQLRLPNTAILSTIFLGRRYISAQWSIMTIVVLGAFIFAQAGIDDTETFNLHQIVGVYKQNRTQCHNVLEDISSGTGMLKQVPEYCDALNKHDPTQKQATNMALGLMYVAIYCFLSDMGSIISEKFLKDDVGTPFYVQKVAIELSGLPTALVMSAVMPFFQIAVGNPKKGASAMWWTGTHVEPNGEESSNWLFQGWGSAALLSLFFNCVGSWLSGLVVKRMSSVMKLLGKVVSLAIVYFFGDCWLMKVEGRDIPMNKTLAQMVVIAATFTFLNIKAPQPAKSKPPSTSPSLTNSEMELRLRSPMSGSGENAERGESR